VRVGEGFAAIDGASVLPSSGRAVRDSVASFVALTLLIGGCGSDHDLVIGRNEIAVVTPQVEAGGLDADGSLSDSSPAVDDAGSLEATPCSVDEIPPAGSLAHRYSFDGTGSIVMDSVGTANGSVVAGAMLDGSGSLTLDGNDDYVNLPNGLISSLDSMSIVAWISTRDSSIFGRVFDFGSSTAAEDQRAKGKTFVMVTPFSNTGDGKELTMQAGTLTGVIQIATDNSIRNGSIHQVALVFRSSAGFELYLDGVLVGTRATRMKLSDIDDVNDWLGQSQYSQDPNFAGTYTEFRIYGQALSACALRATLASGPDLLP